MSPISPFQPLCNLKYGHAILQGVAPSLLTEAKRDIQTYFSQHANYKNQHVSTEHHELGYRNLGHKEVFMVRERNLPAELAICQALASALHQLSLRCLDFIANELQINSTTLRNLVEVDMVPANGCSASLLRLLNYSGVAKDTISVAGDAHEDLGLLTLVCYTGVPALEIYDFRHDQGWLDIETLQNPDDIIVMTGESLSLLSNGYYLPATHRVRATTKPRLAILYQLRFKQDALLDSQQFETVVTDKFKKPFCITGKAFLEKEIALRQSVHGSY